MVSENTPFVSKTKVVDFFNFPSLKCFGYYLSFWIFDIYRPNIAEVKVRGTFYYGLLDTADNMLITDKRKQPLQKNLMRRPPIYIMHVKSSYKLLLSHKDLRSRNFWQWNDSPLNIFKNLYVNVLSLLVFINWKNHCNVSFNDTYKMCCSHFFKWKLKLFETAFLK